MCTKNIDIIRIESGQVRREKDTVISEQPFEIYLNGEFFYRAVCLKDALAELTVGHFVSEGMLASKEDIRSLRIEGDRAFAEIKLKESKPSLEEISVTPKEISRVVGMLYDGSELFRKTGMIHSAMVVPVDKGNGGVLCAAKDTDGNAENFCFGEDIGRHNAVDKALGSAIMSGVDIRRSCLLTSGRMPVDMVRKAVNAQIPIMISRSAPTAEAVKMAQDAGITLVGFARGDRMNIYTGTAVKV